MTLAVGSPGHNANGNDAGRVRVYKFRNGNWARVAIIDGSSAGASAGTSIAMTGDGATIAVGATQALSAGTGQVTVYSLTGATPTPVGQVLAGEASLDTFGSAVAISDDGNTLAVGAPHNDTNGAQAGRVQVFVNSGGTWTPLGNAIDGAAPSDQLGARLASSGDGSTLAIGTHDRSAVYRFNGASWGQLGANLFETTSNNPQPVALSNDGNTVAFPLRAAGVEVRHYNGSQWDTVGNSISFEGTALALSDSGNTVAIGNPSVRDGGPTISPGRTSVFTFDVGDAGSLDDLEDGKVFFFRNAETGRYLDSDPALPNSPRNVDTSGTAGFDDRWRLIDNGDGTWTVQSVLRFNVLNARGNGADFNVTHGLHNNSSHWEITPDINGSFSLRNVLLDRFLFEEDDNNVTTTDSTSDATRWMLQPVG